MNRLDERWDRLASGELSEAEHDELRGLADATAEGYEAYQAFKPLGPAFQQNVAAAILAQREKEASAAAEAAEAALAASQIKDPLPPPKVPAERKGIFKWAGALAAGTVLVAGLLAFPLFQRGIGDGHIYMSVGSSPPRTGIRGAETVPAEPAGPPALRIGSYFLLTLQTEGDLDDGLQQRLYLYQSGKLARLPLEKKVGDEVDLPSSLPLQRGPAQLVLVYFRSGKAPSLERIGAAVARPGKDGDRLWRLALTDVRLEK